MARTAWLGVGLLGVGALVVACPSSSTSTPDDAGAADAIEADSGTICDSFTHSGQPCAPAGPVRCFQQCTTGGCTCKGTATGGVWQCVTDTSCLPDAPPVEDADQPLDDGGPDVADDAPDGD